MRRWLGLAKVIQAAVQLEDLACDMETKCTSERGHQDAIAGTRTVRHDGKESKQSVPTSRCCVVRANGVLWRHAMTVAAQAQHQQQELAT